MPNSSFAQSTPAPSIIPLPCPSISNIFADKVSLMTAFDCLNLQLNQGQGYKNRTNENGTLAWQESRIMLSYIRMFEVTFDRKYLDRFLDHADSVLNQRDSVAGRTLYDGRSLPVWGSNGVSTLGRPMNLIDANGNPSLEIRGVANSHNNVTSVNIEAGSQLGTYKLTLVNTNFRYNVNHVFDNLTQTNVESVVNNPSPDVKKMLEVRVLGPNPPSPRFIPQLRTYRIINCVYVGMISIPYAYFAYFVKSNPSLASDPIYSVKAEEYLSAAETAMQYLDEEWEENGNRGYFRFKKGEPFWADGIVVPHNRYLAPGLAYLYLYQATGNNKYRDRVVKIANNFLYCPDTPLFDVNACLRQDAKGGYIWPYWWAEGALGWTEADNLSINTPNHSGQINIEDTGHAKVDVNFVFQVFRSGIAFSQTDIERFTITITDTIFALLPKFPNRVDGAGSQSEAKLLDFMSYAFAGFVRPEFITDAVKFLSTKDYRQIKVEQVPDTLLSTAEIALMLKEQGHYPIPGDANGDGLVDGQDYVIWLNNYNTQTNGADKGDFDANGIVDGLDYVIWLNHYNK